MNRQNIFLTDTRRDVLEGESDLSGGSLANEKSRIRTRARAAIDELIEVAQSEEIENASIFGPEKVGTLLFWITMDPSEIDHGGLVEPTAMASDEFQYYRQHVAGQVAPSIMSIRNPNRGRFDD
jgi:hypothetical protein